MAQPHEHAHATQVTDTSCEQGWRPNSLVSGVRVQITRNMVAEHPYMEAHPATMFPSLFRYWTTETPKTKPESRCATGHFLA